MYQHRRSVCLPGLSPMFEDFPARAVPITTRAWLGTYILPFIDWDRCMIARETTRFPEVRASDPTEHNRGSSIYKCRNPCFKVLNVFICPTEV